MNSVESYIPKNLLDGFDADLQTFYHDVFLEELGSTARGVAGIKRALREVVHAYKKQTVDCLASSILFDTAEKRCAYVMKHCVCFSSAVARHFLRLVRSHPSGLRQAVLGRQVNLCCLGGGPATEAVGIAKVVNILNNAVYPSWKKHLKPGGLHLKVQVIDLSKDWQTTADLVIKILNASPKLCDSERMVVSLELLQADLTQPLSERVRSVLGEADIITMVYFVSAVNGSRAQGRCASMLKNIVNFAKPKALLFFLDSSKAIHHSSVHSVVCRRENLMKQVYGPVVQEFHTLSMKSIRQFLKLYFDQFDSLVCLTNCFVTCAGWIKADEYDAWASCLGCCWIFRKGRNWKKLVEYNTKKQEWFRQRVERLFLDHLKMDFAIDDLGEHDDFVDPPELHRLPCSGAPLYATKSKQKRIIPLTNTLMQPQQRSPGKKKKKNLNCCIVYATKSKQKRIVPLTNSFLQRQQRRREKKKKKNLNCCIETVLLTKFNDMCSM